MLVEPYTPDKIWSADEYLAWESQQEFKNELIDNRVWIMRGANLRHNSISINVMMALHPTAEEQGYSLLLSSLSRLATLKSSSGANGGSDCPPPRKSASYRSANLRCKS